MRCSRQINMKKTNSCCKGTIWSSGNDLACHQAGRGSNPESVKSFEVEKVKLTGSELEA